MFALVANMPQMGTAAQNAANRRNAKKSTGPRSAAGKDRVRHERPATRSLRIDGCSHPAGAGLPRTRLTSMRTVRASSDRSHLETTSN